MADEVLVDIPAGIEDGQTVRLRIDGEQEVLVQVRVEDGGNLRREGYHVHSDLWIDIWDAAFGKTVTIPGLHGNINIKIPKEINSHTLLVLPERGFQVIYIFLFASFDLTFTQCNCGLYYTWLACQFLASNIWSTTYFPISYRGLITKISLLQSNYYR